MRQSERGLDQTLLAVQMERGRRVPKRAAASGWWKGRWGQSPLGGAGEECILPTSGADPVVSVGALICRMGRWLTCVILSCDIFGDVRSSLPFSHMCWFMSLQPEISLELPLWAHICHTLLSAFLCSLRRWSFSRHPSPHAVCSGWGAFPNHPC